MQNITILVATHKQYPMPGDKMYLPVFVGAQNNPDEYQRLAALGYAGDASGDNISLKNKSYCELTAAYWAWKNLSAEYIGLVHYRRHFRGRASGSKQNRILTCGEAEELLKDCNVLLPKKRRYFIETNRGQYIHAHHAEGLVNTRKVIAARCPEYLVAFDKVMDKTSGHRFNMFVMKSDVFGKYCEWLFGILFDVEKTLDISGWSPKEQRVYGYLAERLLDVWLLKNGVEYRDIPYMFMEKQNWAKKIADFLARKFGFEKK